jgi:hypothetical protein
LHPLQSPLLSALFNCLAPLDLDMMKGNLFGTWKERGKIRVIPHVPKLIVLLDFILLLTKQSETNLV